MVIAGTGTPALISGVHQLQAEKDDPASPAIRSTTS